MTPDRWKRVQVIFSEAIQLKPEERQAYLETTCREDAILMAEVESLLSNDRSRGPLEGPALARLNSGELASAMEAWYDDRGSIGVSSTAAKQMPAAKSTASSDLSRTQLPSELVAEFDPVVGWLVCVQGPDRGRDYRIRTGRNGIGRNSQMEIPITGDERISRENHAIIAYDPRSHQFRLSPGQARGLTYLNSHLLDTPTVLHASDVIELGVTVLQFVPLCGDQFQWT